VQVAKTDGDYGYGCPWSMREREVLHLEHDEVDSSMNVECLRASRKMRMVVGSETKLLLCQKIDLITFKRV